MCITIKNQIKKLMLISSCLKLFLQTYLLVCYIFNKTNGIKITLQFMFLIVFSLLSLVVLSFVQGEDDILLLMETNCQLIKASFLYKSLELDKKCIFYSGMQEERTLICLMVNIVFSWHIT